MITILDPMMRELVQPKYHWSALQLEQRMAANEATLAEALGRGSLLSLAESVVAMAMTWEMHAVADAYFQPDPARLAFSMSSALHLQYLSDRCLRAHQVRSGEDKFTSSLNDLGQLAMQATWMGHQEAAVWFTQSLREFAQDPDWRENDDYVRDREYLRFCVRVADAWKLAPAIGDVFGDSNADDLYAALPLDGREVAMSAVAAVLRERVNRSIKVERGELEASFHYGLNVVNTFFAFELYSYRRLLESQDLLREDVVDPTLDIFGRIRFDAAVTTSPTSIAVLRSLASN